MKFKEGDYVKVVGREATPDDAKSGLFYPYFSGLAGRVDRTYGKEVCINIDLETLPRDILKRHTETQESMRRKWLNSLSNEARNKLTADEKGFSLAYRILVHTRDLEKAKKGKVKPAAIKSVQRLVSAGSSAADKQTPKAPAQAKVVTVERPAEPAKTASKALRAEKAPEKAAKGPKAAAKREARTLEKTARRSRTVAQPTAKASAKTTIKAPKATAKPVAKARVAPSPKTAGKSRIAAKSGAAKPSEHKERETKAKAAHPVTSADLDAAETAFLKQRKKALKGGK